MRKCILTLLFLISTTLSAEIIFYKFTDPLKEERFNTLIEELRCPKCQNNNLADSNAPLSVDLKQIIYDQIHAGASDEEIIDYLKERYGDFIYYKPPMKVSTWFIWFGPFIVLAIGSFFAFRFMKRRYRKESLTEVKTQHLDLVDSWQEESVTHGESDKK